MTRTVDADLYALQGTIRALAEDVPDACAQRVALRSARTLQADVGELRRRTERLLSGDDRRDMSQVEELLTDGCAELARIEAQRVTTKRRVLTLLVDADPSARSQVRELCARYEIIVDELEALRSLIAASRRLLDEGRRASP